MQKLPHTVTQQFRQLITNAPPMEEKLPGVLSETPALLIERRFGEPTVFGAPERIRTSDPLVRSQVLYPAELRVRNFKIQILFTYLSSVASKIHSEHR